MSREVTDNFELETTMFTAAGSMDESGKCQITKRFLYNIVDNSPSKRMRATLDLETLVPVKGSCMSDDARYTMKSATWNCLNWQNQSTKFYIDAVYKRISDDDAASAPWNLAPFNVHVSAVEQDVPFKYAYNKKNEKKIPVVNAAADPIEATTREIIPQYSFSFYAKRYDVDDAFEFSNSVNRSSERILGHRYPAGTLFMMPISVSCLVTYDDDGYTEKWKYYQVDMSIRYREDGWQKILQNIGNRARFEDNKAPEEIYQYYKFSTSNGTFAKKPSWENAVTYHSEDTQYRTWLAANKTKGQKLPAHIPYEFGEKIPLTDDGKVNTTVLNTDITDPNYTGYPTRKFTEYKELSWSPLDIPTEIKKKWR